MNKAGKNENKLQDQGQDSTAGFDHTGAYLRKLRTEKGLSVKEACEATRISEINLTAIENQDFATLPAETFTRGLLNIYARYLEADPAHVVARFMREREQRNQGGGKRGRPRQTNHKILTPKKLAEPAHISSITMAVALLLSIMVLFTGFCLYTSWNPFSFLSRETDSLQSVVMQSLPVDTAPSSVPPVAGSEETAPSLTPAASQTQPAEGATAEPRENPAQASSAQAPPVQALPAGQEGPPPAPAKLNSVSIEFLKNSRLTYVRDHEQPVSNLYKKGEKLSWTESTSMQFIFDLPDSAIVQVNGQPVSFPAESSAGYTLSIPADLPHSPGQ
jgi:cytoskeletal protein RodZ